MKLKTVKEQKADKFQWSCDECKAKDVDIIVFDGNLDYICEVCLRKALALLSGTYFQMW